MNTKPITSMNVCIAANPTKRFQLNTIVIALLCAMSWTAPILANQPQVLWTQYCVANGTLKLAAHTDADPESPVEATARLMRRTGTDWETILTVDIDPITAMAKFRIDNWDASTKHAYRVTCGESTIEGVIRAEPDPDSGTLKMMAIACVKDEFYPQSNAVAQTISQDPDLVFFAGDQIYESNAGGEIVEAESEDDLVPAMANYLAKWRRFGLMFRDLLKDRPSILITDDHDVYADDLWGRGGRRMRGNRTTGGYRMHPSWVNAVEETQTWHLPDAANPGPWGDGIRAYFTSLDYGGVSFAILEDRKFKSAPSEVLDEPISAPGAARKNDTMEVIEDPSFDETKLDRESLQLLGETQEKFVTEWSAKVQEQSRLAAVLSQSPYVNVGNYNRDFGDMDSNGWPQSGRNRALRAIKPSQAVMISGDIHYGTLVQHGIDQWGDGPWSFSVPAFTSNQNRTWNPRQSASGGEVPGVEGSGNHRDRFGNLMTLVGKADGLQGYGMVLFDKNLHQITLEIYTFDSNREPKQVPVAGWPKVIQVTK
mgnify:CR=1 FL=1|tara:strand:- start:143601 stop:145217 length:1617 start_codon:yes stop_codon:yes gene_type:complete